MTSDFTDRQKEVLNAALEIIGREGMGHLTIRNVARTVGFSEPALYRHFQNKTELLELLLDYVSSMHQALFRQATSNGKTGQEILELFLTRMFIEFSRMPALVPLLFTDELFHQAPELRKRLDSTVETQLQRFTDLVRAMQQSGEWRDDCAPRDLAVVMLGTIRLSVVIDGGGPDGDRAKEVAGLLIRLVAKR